MTATTVEYFASDVDELRKNWLWDGLPEIIRCTWSPTTGLTVDVDQQHLPAWFAATLNTDPNSATREVLVGHVVYQWTDRLLNTPAKTPVTICSKLPVTEAQIAVQRASDGLSFEEVAAWFADWPTLSPESQITEWREMHDRFKVPVDLLPSPLCTYCTEAFQPVGCDHCTDCATRCLDCCAEARLVWLAS